MPAAGPAIYIIRRYDRENLHESSRSVDGTSDTCLCNVFICFRCTVMGCISTACKRLSVLSLGFDQGCHFTNVKVCVSTLKKLPLSSLEREIMVILECCAIHSVGGLSKRVLVAFDQRAISSK